MQGQVRSVGTVVMVECRDDLRATSGMTGAAEAMVECRCGSEGNFGSAMPALARA